MILMHKNIPVLKFELFNFKPAVALEIYNEKELPVGLRGDIDFIDKNLMSWHSSRTIPNGRLNLSMIKDKLSLFGGLEKVTLDSLGLSLTDCYWYKPEDLDLSWENINFRDNGFSEDLFDMEINEFLKPGKSPDYKTNGALKKFWTIQDGVPMLFKSGDMDGITNYTGILAANEVIAGKVAAYLGFNHVDYYRALLNDEFYCVSECFTKRDEDLITGRDVLDQHETYYEDQLYKFLVSDYGIEKELKEMAVIDVLLHNIDRHPDNIGLIFDANTNEFKRVAPIFDTGSCLGFYSAEFDLQNINNMKFPERNRIDIMNKYLLDEYKITSEQANEIRQILKSTYEEFSIPEDRYNIALQELNTGLELLLDREIDLEYDMDDIDIADDL